VALVTCAVAVYAVVHSELKSDDGGGGAKATSTSTTGKSGTTTTRKSAASKHKTYTVKSGDVLSAIAIKTGTSVAALEKLNPKMDAATLHPGQKLKLR
jgi:LysM repeat protein